MVEASHTAGWLPHVSEPLRHIRDKLADWFAPKSEASANEAFYRINVELPGVKAEDVDVSVQDNGITVRGEKRFERSETGRTYFFSEREYGAFQRSFRLPGDAYAQGIEADFEDGVLTIKVPKQAAETATHRKIDVRKA